MYYRDDKLSKSQINRKFIDALGFKNVSVKRFHERILPNVKYTIEKRGMPYNPGQQRHTKVYRAGDIVDYIVSERKRINKKK